MDLRVRSNHKEYSLLPLRLKEHDLLIPAGYVEELR